MLLTLAVFLVLSSDVLPDGSTEDGDDVLCGVTEVPSNLTARYPDRIVNGWEAHPHSIPWQSRVRTTILPGVYGHCGGALIQLEKGNGTDLVITAAHCLHTTPHLSATSAFYCSMRTLDEVNYSTDSSALYAWKLKLSSQNAFRKRWASPWRIEVTVGAHHLLGDEPHKKSIKASSYMGGSGEHAYNHSNANNDFVVIRLKEKVPYTAHTRPICLPNPKEPLPFNRTCYTSGWGSTDVHGTELPLKLMQVDAKILPYEHCDKEIDNKTMLCAGSPGEQKGVCFGDSGGPLSCEVSNVWVLYGIVSWGRKCASPTEHAVFTHVSNFVEDIREIGKRLKTDPGEEALSNRERL